MALIADTPTPATGLNWLAQFAAIAIKHDVSVNREMIWSGGQVRSEPEKPIGYHKYTA
jgi:hypothetical protein